MILNKCLCDNSIHFTAANGRVMTDRVGLNAYRTPLVTQYISQTWYYGNLSDLHYTLIYKSRRNSGLKTLIDY